MVSLMDGIEKELMSPYTDYGALLLLGACILVYVSMRLFIAAYKRNLYELSTRTHHWIQQKYQKSRLATAQKLQAHAIKQSKRKKEKENEKDLEDLI